MNSRIRPTLYNSLKSWLCTCSLASLAPQKLLIFVLVSLQRTAEGTQKARVALCGAWSNSYASFVLSKLPACSTDISTYAIFSHLPQTESLFSGYYVFGLRFVSSTTQTSVASVSFRKVHSISLMRQRAYVEILSTREVQRARKRRKSCSRRRRQQLYPFECPPNFPSGRNMFIAWRH